MEILKIYLEEQLLIKYCVICKAFKIAKNPNMIDINADLLQWFINVLIKKTSGGTIKNGYILNKELSEELHKPIIRNFKKRKLHASFIDNILGADLADMQLISKFNKGICFLLSVIDIFSNCAWLIPLKDKRGITITNAFQKLLDESNRKPNKRCVYKGREFYSRSMKSWLEQYDIEIY